MPPPSDLTLVIANKNYSSWSARPWLVMTYFTLVVSRFVTYDVALPGDAKRYQATLLGTRAMRTWTEAALEETEFVPMDKPYASPD